jgi:hypothetical protein
VGLAGTFALGLDGLGAELAETGSRGGDGGRSSWCGLLESRRLARRSWEQPAEGSGRRWSGPHTRTTCVASWDKPRLLAAAPLPTTRVLVNETAAHRRLGQPRPRLGWRSLTALGASGRRTALCCRVTPFGFLNADLGGACVLPSRVCATARDRSTSAVQIASAVPARRPVKGRTDLRARPRAGGVPAAKARRSGITRPVSEPCRMYRLQGSRLMLLSGTTVQAGRCTSRGSPMC